MSSPKENFPDEVKELVNKIIIKNNLDSTSEIVYSTGSELGDGYMSKTVAVNVNSRKEDLNLFIKYALNAKFLETLNFHKIYENEITFYEKIMPTYTEFLKEKGIENGFRNVPKCYGASKNIVALENLKKKGFQLCDKALVGNDEHITLVLKTYAKFHAISFAFQDQKSEEYRELVSSITDIFALNADNERTVKQQEMMRNEIKKFLEQLDPDKDKYILDRSENLADKVVEFSKSLNKPEFGNSVITQGDCWCNNMMFMYEDDKEVPVDVMLIDWQIIRPASPVFDLCYFYYTAASVSKESLKKLYYYLNIYYEELSAQISKMGSDPEVLYPFSVLKTEWKQFCKFGYYMSYTILKAMLSSKNEVPDFEVTDFEKAMTESMFPVLQRNEEYIERLKNLTEHFLLNDFF